MSSAEDGDVQRAEKRLAHGTPDVNEKLGVDIRLHEEFLHGFNTITHLLGEPFDAEAAALQRLLQEVACMEIFESVVFHNHLPNLLLFNLCAKRTA